MNDNSKFDPASFKLVELNDRSILEPRLIRSMEQSCEFNFANLFMWGKVYGSKWSIWNDHLYLSMADEAETIRILMFVSDPVCGEPEPEELRAVSDAVITVGNSGVFQHVQALYLKRHPNVLTCFDARPMDTEFVEYIYEVQALAELHGRKLAKKRNLIAQFKRDNPNCYIKQITSDLIPECLKLAVRWREEYPDQTSPYLAQEADALHHLLNHFDSLDLVGLAGYVDKNMVAFELCSRINTDMFTEHFEKSLHEYKGATQFVNNEMAKLLVGQCKLLNREQDLGNPGLRRAKLSYEPLYLLQNYLLIRK